MKAKTKEHLKTGGIVLGGLAALYFLMQKDEGYAGFGGGGGIPLLPGDTEGAAEGDTTLPEWPGWPELPEDFWDTEERFDYKKAQVVMEKFEKTYAPIGTAYEKTVSLGAPTAADVAAYGKEKNSVVKVDGGEEGAAWYAPWAWDWSKAAENYQAWATRSTERTLGRDPSTPSADITSKKAAELSRAVTAAKTAAIVHKASVGIIKPYRSYGGGGTYPTSVRIGSPTSKKSTSQKLSAETASKTAMRRASGYGGYI